MSLSDENNDYFGDSYSAPEVSAQSLDSGGNYVSPMAGKDGDLEPLASGEIP